MKNNKVIEFKKENAKKSKIQNIKEGFWKSIVYDSNKNELTLNNDIKSIELYKPYTFKELQEANKKKFKEIKVKYLIATLENILRELYTATNLYKELKDKTEFWEEKETYKYNFKDWNTIKKVNGKISRYYKELKEIKINIERSKSENN